ncbi:probable rRNA maturation factor [Nitrosospira multiformis]|uniref:Endoribonuclease YbeY n=1 Tax=Nitrosospira multiformis TaxID=1231 RepID=A0A1I0FAX8_9PROT|nr:rRNA maturation RNase YbeY [Nitrosospira multiformis]SET54669.1 probable rRNA maturation factor [Nitrosospira multiformis]
MKERSNSTGTPDSIVHPKPKPAKLKMTVQYATSTREPLPPRALLRKWVKAALAHDAEIALRIVDEEEGRRLNRDFRNKDYATNVLTFVYRDGQIDPEVPLGEKQDAYPLTGDIVLCAPVVENEAGQQQKDLMAHYAHLTVHGVLHLQGYDHQEDEDAKNMEETETRILAWLGYEDPYAGYQSAEAVDCG